MKPIVILVLNFISFSIYAQKTGVYWDSDLPILEKWANTNHAKKDGSHRVSANSNIDVSYYRCEWKVDPAVKFISGEVTVYFTMLSGGDQISLDLTNSLNVLLVKNNGQLIQFEHQNNTVNMVLPVEYQSGEMDSVTVVYQGVPPLSNMGAFEVSVHGDNFPLIPVMWTLSEPYGSSDWWPCKNDLADKADSLDIFITHPANYKAVSNGLLKNEIQLQGNLTKSHWKHKYPIASYLVCFAVTNYVASTSSIIIGGDNIPFITYSYPESQIQFQAGVPPVSTAMALFSSLLGEYPFKTEKYAHVQFGWGGGMEHQTCSFMINMNEFLISHELAHHWFGDKITCGNWHDVWLNEGFASFLSELYFESKYPASALMSRVNSIDYITSLPGGSVWVDDIEDLNRVFDQRLSYAKGSHVLYMLRWILGDATFFTAIKNYINDPALAYGFVTTANLKAHLEAASGKDLTYFFNQWFTGQGHPSYQVEWHPSGNAVQVKLSQTQSHASVQYFQLPVPLLFRNAVTNQQKLVVLNNTYNGELFFDDLGFEATEVYFDPDSWLIARNNTLTKTSGPLPVVFSTFHARCTDGVVRLSWETSEEVNAGYFELQKSDDAFTWRTLGELDAVGNSKQSNQYAFTDPEPGTGKSYYRVVEHDVDGKTQTTRIVSSGCGAAQHELTVYPNPVGEYLHLRVPQGSRNLSEFFVYDIKGGSMLVKNSSAGGEEVRLDVRHLKPGLYFLAPAPGGSIFKFVKE